MFTSLAIWSATTPRIAPKRRTTSRTWRGPRRDVALLRGIGVVAHLQLHAVAGGGVAPGEGEEALEAGLAVRPEEAVQPQHERAVARPQVARAPASWRGRSSGTAGAGAVPIWPVCTPGVTPNCSRLPPGRCGTDVGLGVAHAAGRVGVGLGGRRRRTRREGHRPPRVPRAPSRGDANPARSCPAKHPRPVRAAAPQRAPSASASSRGLPVAQAEGQPGGEAVAGAVGVGGLGRAAAPLRSARSRRRGRSRFRPRVPRCAPPPAAPGRARRA